ncbi:helicase-exonuclease AddAB subunit AddA [Fusibacter ferrireducens]|uniref:ATP-dependent helicase/nuclease subunit A n=1 Tax=Fusibacter ferrireducens TaxID=2785058 RepID=A0ABR9ZY85_9FIRM|nr:helicase-exonuclease AddAB subunit AddA [Fusibacter ferrireducens]MBF4695331.1 helicase-exonuclease AddAB subunit AddA [Fusibacter ferrireducens]
MPSWTREQEAAIYLRNADMLVSAAAGSGKTAVLVERIIKIVVHQRVPIQSILVVTYTNAAAGEMRERIEVAVSKAIETEADPELKAFLIDQLRVLNRASIKTFHAFCMDIIRSHFQKISIDPSFRMLNEMERTILIEEAIDAVFESAYESSEASFIYLVEAYSGNREDQRLRDMIKQIYRFVMSQPYPMKWLEYQVEAYEQEAHPLRKIWEKILLEQARTKVEGAFELLEEGLEICEMPGGPLPYKETLLSDYAQFKRIDEAIALENVKALEAAILNFSFTRLKSIKKDEKASMDEALVETVKTQIRDKLLKKNIYESLAMPFREKTLDRYFEEFERLAPALRTLKELVEAFDANFMALKNSKNVLDFNDLEHYAIKVLEDDAIAKTYQNQFEYIFVDEYQDASSIQETILTRIKRSNNIFMVGDVKQSIYKFRLAEPALFLEKFRTYAPYDQVLKQYKVENVHELNPKLEGMHAIRIDLKKNFRTRTEILETVNKLFSNMMSERLGEITYDDSAHLVGGAKFEALEGPAVSVKVISKKPLNSEGLGEIEVPLEEDSLTEMDEVSLGNLKTDEIEARTIAREIKRIIGTPIYFPKTQMWRTCSYKDIVILIRSFRSWQETFDSVFSEEGVPFYAESNSGYFDTLEIRLMMDYLKILDNPYQDISLMAVLRSPMYRFTIDELIYMRQLGTGDQYFYDQLNYFIDLEDDGNPNEVLKEKVRFFLNQLEAIRKFATYNPIDDVILKILQETQFFNYVSVMPGGVARQANLKLLIERATQFKNSKIVSLTLFVQFYEQLSKNSGDMGVASSIGETDDVVRLMSIHKSKGLEFPVVMVAGLGRKFNLMDTHGDLIMHKHIGMGLSYVDVSLRAKSASLVQLLLKEQLKVETLSEEMRVLYVALTRPVDRLYLFGTVADAEKRFAKWQRGCSYYNLFTAGGFIDWILSVNPKACDIIDPSTLISIEQASSQSNQKSIEKWINLKQQAMLEKDRVQDSERDAAQNSALDREIGDRVPDEAGVFERLNTLLPAFEQTYEPQKIAVSDLKKKEFAFNAPVLIQTPQFLLEELPLTPAEKGTAMHKVLEKIDFTQVYTEATLQKFISELVTSRFLTEQEFKAIEISKIGQFLSSELGIRIRNERHFKETPFVVKVNEQLVQGIIDLYLETDEGIILIDYKTDFVGDCDLQKVANQYRIQLDAYKMALESILNKPVIQKVIVFLNYNRAVEI